MAAASTASAVAVQAHGVVAAFELLVLVHILTGSVGLISMWVPVLSAKASANHRFWGRIFIYSMLVTGTIAVGISVCSLAAPLATHTFSQDAALMRGLFGWMMMYLGWLTVALAWHSFVTVRHKQRHERIATPSNFAVQVLMGLAAVNCALRGALLDQPIMIGVAIPGLAAALINLWYLLRPLDLPDEWLVQHFRCGIGAGISVYTAFFAFGAVNWFPALAFNPVLWAIPTVLGVGFMIRHQWAIFRQRQRRGLADRMVAGRVLSALMPGLRQT